MIESWQIAPAKICSSWLLFLALDLCSVSQGSNSAADIESHLQRGKDFLARGQLQDALSHYHAAVEGDPHNYLTYFKRGTVYLALGKAKFALLDFDKVLELKPDFHSARLQRGLVLMKQAEIDKAKQDLYHVHLNTDPATSQEALDHYVRLDNLQYEIDSSQYYFDHGDYHSAAQLLSKIIETCPWSSALRELRSKCHLQLGDTESAIYDLRSATKLLSDNTEGFYKLSTLQYRLGRLSDSLKEIRECLKLDPEHKLCFPHYKKVKKIDKLMADCEDAANSKDYGMCVEKAKKVLLIEDTERMIVYLAKQKLCHCYLHNEQFALSLQFCQEALDIHRSPEVHCDKAEAYIASEMFDEAVHEFNRALELDREFQRAVNGQQRAQKLQKQSERRDYYKILNVKRTATKQEIVKAYRKAAQKWHPDNFKGEEKKMAEKKFIDIAAAKEVLTDPEKRQKFDNGEDPLDPESGQHPQGFNPFQHFSHFQQGGPFTFKFNFH